MAPRLPQLKADLFSKHCCIEFICPVLGSDWWFMFDHRDGVISFSHRENVFGQMAIEYLMYRTSYTWLYILVIFLYNQGCFHTWKSKLGVKPVFRYTLLCTMLWVCKEAVRPCNCFSKTEKDISLSIDGRQFFILLFFCCVMLNSCWSVGPGHSPWWPFSHLLFVFIPKSKGLVKISWFIISEFLTANPCSSLYYRISPVLIIWFTTNGDSLCCASCDLDPFSDMFSWNRMWVWNHAGGSCSI